MRDLVTTNIRFTKDEYQLIKDQARKKKVSMAEYVRESVSMRLKPKTVDVRSRSIWDIRKHAISASGLSDQDFTNESIDKAIYGDPHGRHK